ncbi:MAG: hypothetical protein ACOY46_03785 [Bacillota bacterium]
MQKILEGLQEKQIIKSEDILALREYIGRRYPGAASREAAAILANAVHRVIDRHIQEFDQKDRFRIRKSLLEKAVYRKNFSIHAGDVFRTCLEIRNGNEEYDAVLARWVSGQQEVPISREALQHFTRGQGRPVREFLKIKREVPVSIEVSSNVINIKLIKKNKAFLAVSCIALCLITFNPFKNMLSVSFDSVATAQTTVVAAGAVLPEGLQYRDIDTAKLKAALIKRNSILADELYFSAILQAAREYNVNPLLLFAITGQEQAFVPRTDENAAKIANNPFNVYHSWTEYNTNISDSARIAANTVVSLSRNRPAEVDPLVWLNRKYAEDSQWWVGVSQIIRELQVEVGENS